MGIQKIWNAISEVQRDMQQPGDTYKSKKGIKANQLSLSTATREPSWDFI
jgi:hypothetical protein